MTETVVHPLLVSGYGLIEADFDRVVERFGSHRRADQSTMHVLEITDRVARASEWLDRRTVPATRLVIVENGGWTAVVTNHRTGSDFNDHVYWAATTVSARAIRVVDSEARWWRRSSLRERLAYEGRLFDLRDDAGDSVRSITCADDGDRWAFETSGTPLAVEATFEYDAPRRKDRFTRRNLHDLLESLGATSLTPDTFLGAPRFGLLEERIADREWRGRVDADACSLDEADDPAFGYFRRGMGWVPHMKTHAPSVIADFERAIEINPAYEPRVRDYLREARRIVGG